MGEGNYPGVMHTILLPFAGLGMLRQMPDGQAFMSHLGRHILQTMVGRRWRTSRVVFSCF